MFKPNSEGEKGIVLPRAAQDEGDILWRELGFCLIGAGCGFYNVYYIKGQRNLIRSRLPSIHLPADFISNPASQSGQP